MIINKMRKLSISKQLQAFGITAQSAADHLVCFTVRTQRMSCCTAAEALCLGPVVCLPCRKQYDIVVVSPRNYFLYTPLLPAVAVGTMEEHSVVEPVRNLVHDKVGA